MLYYRAAMPVKVEERLCLPFGHELDLVTYSLPVKRQQNERPPAAFRDLFLVRFPSFARVAAHAHLRSRYVRTDGASGHVTVVSRSSEIVLASVNNLANSVRRLHVMRAVLALSA